MKIGTEKRYIAKIVTGFGVERRVEYYRSDMTFEFLKRWEWFFEYRAALLKVKNPRLKVELEIINYDYQLPRDVYQKRLKNIIKSKKGNLTKFLKKLDATKAKHKKHNSLSLFPKKIEDEDRYYKVEKKLKAFQYSLAKAENKLKEFNNHQIDIPSDIATAPYSTKAILDI